MDLLSATDPFARALAERGYTDLTAVQSAVIDPETQGRDLLVSAQTGSGKTVAYGLAIADTLLAGADQFDLADAPLALIIAPTRELALQVHDELAWLYRPAGAVVVACVGGMDPRAEARALGRGAHIVVGTPGRLRDHLERGALRPESMRAVVLDEADEMLDLGFSEDIGFLLDTTPAERRTLLFSATLPREILRLAGQYQRDALRIALTGGASGHADIEHRVVRVAPTDIEHTVVNLLRYVDAPTSMVFCATRESVRHLQASLMERGFGVVALSGELSQGERNHALQALRDGRARVCVATDVAARGIDLPSLDLVIHAELPRTAQTLQHRSGRTGRAGRKGVSVMLAPVSRRRRVEGLLAEAGISVEWTAAPTIEEILEMDRRRLLSHPVLTEAPSDEERAIAQALLAERPAEDLALALVRLYNAQLPSAEEVFDPGEPPPRAERRERSDRGDRGERAERPARANPRDLGPTVWFRLNIGREKNADPRWLIPLICRQGRIAKTEIGEIRIQPRETVFEVAGAVSEHFLQALKQTPRPEGRIDLIGDTPPARAPATRDDAAPAPRVRSEKGAPPRREGRAEGAPPRRDENAPPRRETREDSSAAWKKARAAAIDAAADGAPPSRPDRNREDRPERKPRPMADAGSKPEGRKKDSGEKGKGWAKPKPAAKKPWGKTKGPMAGKPGKKKA
jgi:ATP-dependent RNA helicase DeaD